MGKFYYQKRNVGSNPDRTKYYFNSIEELVNQVDILKSTESSKKHIQWSIGNNNFNENQFTLMAEFWDTERRGTETPLKCKGWFVYGYIYNDETDKDIYDIFPIWVADYRNHFIERRYISVSDFSSLSEDDKLKLNKDGGLILNRYDF